MSKEEIALELTKLAYSDAQRENKIQNDKQPPEEIVTSLYNYIFMNLREEPSK